MEKEDAKNLENRVEKAIHSLREVEGFLLQLDSLSGEETQGLPYLEERIFQNERNALLDLAEELAEKILPEIQRNAQD
ncbi:hypothetical protein [Corynebacterium rouxii]|uniref:hypothetical protein n=1 Tax=Corynebacterium rouxii TaxID=2719119 RepID=UPI00313E5FC5